MERINLENVMKAFGESGHIEKYGLSVVTVGSKATRGQ